MTECTFSTALREMPEEERPRERLARLGAIALRDAELLARIGANQPVRAAFSITTADDSLSAFLEPGRL